MLSEDLDVYGVRIMIHNDPYVYMCKMCISMYIYVFACGVLYICVMLCFLAKTILGLVIYNLGDPGYNIYLLGVVLEYLKRKSIVKVDP